ncbi:MAG: SDR family oxidoreductase [Rubricoccaceae bacterium]|nr:SDR family oxidoreductase [Rubricoccaceae bacterium]
MLFPRVLLTGADGLVGQALQRRLAHWREADVLATGLAARPRMRNRPGGYVPLDVTDEQAVERLFLDFAPSVVVHAAARSKVEACEDDREGCWAVNVDATATLARLCKRHGARLVFLSTDFLFDGTDGPYAEDDRPAPVNGYGRSKLAAENAVRLVGNGRWTIVRTSLVFGTGEHLRRLNIATLLARVLGDGQPFDAATDQMRSPTYAPDLADGLLRLVRYEKDGVYHLAGRERLSVYDFCRRAAVHFGFDPSRIRPTTTAALHPDAPRPLDGGLLILRAESEVRFRPRSLDAALRDLAPRLGLPVPVDGGQ